VVSVLAIAGAGLTSALGLRPGSRAEANTGDLKASPGAGALFGWLGGFRALAADFLWLRLYAGWEERDLPGTQTLIRAVVAVDPRPMYFWLNGARILAYDLPVWRIAAEGGYEALQAERRKEIETEQARLALRHLEAARRVQRDPVPLWLERANIELNKLGDVAAAAASYRQAWEAPGGPYYAARIYAELLKRQGRNPEAYQWLRELHRKLPRDDEAADAPLVLARIRELEKVLAIAPADRYQVPD
jgi:tetratricopeptide (TPR) repeat protein